MRLPWYSTTTIVQVRVSLVRNGSYGPMYLFGSVGALSALLIAAFYYYRRAGAKAEQARRSERAKAKRL